MVRSVHEDSVLSYLRVPKNISVDWSLNVHWPKFRKSYLEAFFMYIFGLHEVYHWYECAKHD